MISARSVLRSLPVVAALVLGSVPALAANPPVNDILEIVDRTDDQARFPMPADQFQRLVNRRIEQAQRHLEQLLEKRNVPPAKRAEIRKAAEAAAARVRQATTRVCADGKVTREEAKEVRDLAKQVVKELRDHYGRGRKHG